MVALKTRSIAPEDAVRQSLEAARLAEGAGLRAVPVQILLDLRFDADGQYRPGGGSPARPARRRPRRRLPGLPGDGPAALHGPPLRRRQAAVGIGHGEASAHPDDRPRHPPLAAPADQRRGRADHARHRARGTGGAGRSLRGGAQRRACGWSSPMRWPTSDLLALGAGTRRTQAGHRRLGHRARPAGEFPPRRQACRQNPGRKPVRERPGGGALRLLLDGLAARRSRRYLEVASGAGDRSGAS